MSAANFVDEVRVRGGPGWLGVGSKKIAESRALVEGEQAKKNLFSKK